MSKKIFIILLILLIITIVSVYSIYNYRSNIVKAQKISKEYENYYDIEVLGTELISIINKTIDINEKHQISKQQNGNYIENNTNSIKIYVKFIYKNDTKIVSMEDIASTGIETFIKNYSTENFKCTQITYHEKTKNVKSLMFEEL